MNTHDPAIEPPVEPLERRPEARSYKVDDLLAEVRAGKVRIPDFQRPLKWQRSDASKLLDSIYRGYPIGTLLFWETRAGPGTMHFGPIAIDAPERSDALWVVDGQQRIVSLARVLLAEQPDADEFALYFDLDQSEFVAPPRLSSRQAEPARWLPMTVVLDAEKLMQWAFQAAAQDELRRKKAFLLGKRIREYEIPAYLVRSSSETTLREIFGRTNSAGKGLEANEVFDALHGGRSGSQPATIREIATELEQFGFGRVDEELLYKLLRVLQGKDFAEPGGGGPLRLDETSIEGAYTVTAEAAARVVQFVKQDGEIPHYALLPHKQPLVTLGKFFHLHPTPSPRTRELLVRWLWRGILGGAHKGETVSTRKMLARIGESEAESIAGMLDPIPDAGDTWPRADSVFNFRFATSKLQTLALLDLKPRDLETGAALDLAKAFDDSNGALPVPAILKPPQKPSSELFTSSANRLAHPSRRGLRRLLLAVEDPAILQSHGISEPAMAALRRDDHPRFLELRAKTLNAHFRAFFDRRARWRETDRPAIADLIVPEEVPE
ncbi:MAG TPA: hypothetical protein DDZ76_02315 [Xanthomonadales bacterium]|nr:hypothetical protein [Xanthomonadales bacterium]